MKIPHRPVVLLAPGSALLGQNQVFSTFFADANPVFDQVGRNARVQKYNGSVRIQFVPNKNFFDQKSLKSFVNGVRGKAIMGDLDAA